MRRPGVEVVFLCSPQNLKNIFFSLGEIILIDQNLPDCLFFKVKQTNKQTKKWRYVEGTIKTLVDKRNKEGSQQS